jgi:putative transposase
MSAASQLAIVPRSLGQWLTAEQVMEQMAWSRRTFFRRCNELISRESNVTSSNGRPQREYLANSLPASARTPAAATHLAVVAPPVSPLGPLFANLPKQEARTVLPDSESQAQADKRLGILEPILNFTGDPARYAHLQLGDGRPITSLERMIEYVASTSGQSPRTIKRWLSRFRSHGFAELADRGRRDKGVCRWGTQSEQHAEIAQIVMFARLQEDLHTRMCWEIACAQSKQRNIAPPSYETIRQLLENIPAPIKTLALKGRRKYDEIFAPFISRGYEDMAANEIWVSDHAIHDVLVQNDLFDARDRQHMRLRFTGILDMRSRKFVGYAWSQEGSSRSIVTCLRHAIQRFGAPRLFYCDNGKDYQKVGKGAGMVWGVGELTPEARGVISRLGIDIQYCQPFHPQSKLIERANNTLHQRFDRRWLTYTGPTPEQRPDRCIAALERHKKLLTAGRVEDSDLPLASEFIRAAIAWIEGEYHQKAKDVRGMAGMTPDEAFDAFRWAEQPAPPAPHELAALLAERTTCKVQECAITLAGRRYVTDDEMGNRMMHYHTGKRITVAFDPLDMDSAAAFDEDGRLIAYLQPETLVRQSTDDETREAIAASMQQRRRRYRETREQIEALGRNVRSTGYTTQHEQMLQIGRMPFQIGDLAVARPSKPGLKPAEDSATKLVPGEAADRLAARLRRNSSVDPEQA